MPILNRDSLCILRHFALCFGQALSIELSGMATVAAPILFSVLLIGAVYTNPENSQARKSFKGYVYAVTKTRFTLENKMAFFLFFVILYILCAIRGHAAGSYVVFDNDKIRFVVIKSFLCGLRMKCR